MTTNFKRVEIDAEGVLHMNIWQRVRDFVDRLLGYNPNPPVVIERDGRTIIVSDSLNPEANAMALAMYSRSPKSFLLHYYEVLRKGWKKFIAQYYVGYGHKSIGDCGSTTICIEHGSMLEAKAIQDNPLYNGQEASTRYLDMAGQDVMNPLETEEGFLIQSRWMDLYTHVLERITLHLYSVYPLLPGEDEKVYEKAIKAKAFDISRAYLPAGCTTYVGWHATLRQAWDHTKEMLFHPLLEVRESAKMILEALKAKYPSSFGYKTYPEQDAYLLKCGRYNYHTDPECPYFDHTHTISEGVGEAKELLKTRPQKTELPDWFKKYHEFNFRFLLDFGSFRDLQRHRSCTQLMPLLTLEHGFNKWYLDSLPEDLRDYVLEVIAIQEAEIKKIEDPLVRQYYIAMGYNVACNLTAGLPSAVYIAELRSGQTVHPTLRVIAQKMGLALKESIPYLALYCDMSPDEWSTKRGLHDIVKKK